ncbi:P-loop containing nucleoside triphosphate hydrolase protein [Hypoxylon trugodes]|uniref:P-loop containing nucleoside triphosphate hydrolase protein n=1 Tax=Hypoxylon trugodes TaxID=326681 RepID=UPI002194B0DD|nr:P-loop containing nucleoside triphosphate hydrolase protein [Hypoxylon trugodes]KAI1389993.1 P-loop containing nucleoside triphosphate hydrolase protein [Hypoxylon trugodes]
MARPPDPIVISDDDATESSDSSAKPNAAASAKLNVSNKRKLNTENLGKEENSSEEDFIYEIFKKRKKTARKSSSKKGKGKASVRSSTPKTAKRRLVDPRLNDDEDSESESDANALSYLKARRDKFDEDRKILRDGGLRLPPDYSDIYFSDDENLENLEEKPQFDEKSGIKPSRPYKDVVLEHSAGVIPASIAQYLREYQIKGVEFLHHLFVYQKGGILGDDMGLGKTVQVAAFLTVMFGKTGDRRDAKRMRKFRRAKVDDWYPRALIICPGSVINNWKNELNRWGWWTVDLYHGAGKEDVLGAASAGRLEIMITTYGTYKRSYDQINETPWDVVVADECHIIKEPSAGVTKAMNQVNSLCRIGLTGTAIQNKYEELWTLLNWTNPGTFGTIRDWKDMICKPLKIGQSHEATLTQLSEARKTARKLRDNLLPRFFLRRMKSLIAHQLPKKTDRVVFCPLSDIQREAYENILGSDIANFVRTAFDFCPCGSKKKRGSCCYAVNAEGESWKSLVFPTVIALQKLSNHFNLIIPQSSDILDKHKRELRFLQAAMPQSWEKYYSSRESLLNLANPEYCGKWKVLKKLLIFWHANGDKVLVFSHSVRLLKMLQHLFNNTNYSFSYLDGTLNYDDRQQVVDDFNSDPNQFVFLISTKAGGVGLNITSANKVVIMDPHWNPSYDLQAQDRAYRIGQVRDVEVYRLISTGTIEEVTYARQIYKQQQANIGYNASNERRYFKGVQQDADRKGEIFGLQNLLAYHGDQVILRDIVNKTNIAEAKAGVKLINIDMDKAVKDVEEEDLIKKEEDADDETGGLKQLSARLIKGENKNSVLKAARAQKLKQFDAVQAILASEGVEYTHDNAEVVGSSKIEDELSRQAEMVASGDEEDPEARALFFDSLAASAAGAQIEHEYNPPVDVRRRQFCTMAETFGFPSVTEFALAVESMEPEERRNCLEQFYRKRAEKLKSLGEAIDLDAGLKTESESDTKEDIKMEEVKIENVQHTPIKSKDEADERDIKLEDIKPYMPPIKQENIKPEIEESPSAKEDVKEVKKEERRKKSERVSMTIWIDDADDTDEL